MVDVHIHLFFSLIMETVLMSKATSNVMVWYLKPITLYHNFQLDLKSILIHFLGPNWWGAFYENKIVIFSLRVDNMLVIKRIDLVFLVVMDGLIAIIDTIIKLPKNHNWYLTHYQPNMYVLESCWRQPNDAFTKASLLVSKCLD